MNSLVDDQIDELPPEAMLALLEVLDAMTFDPFEFNRRPGEVVNDVKNIRNLPFGSDGQGMVQVLIWKPQLRMLVTQVSWLG